MPEKPADSSKKTLETDPFRALIQAWLDYCRADGLSEKTINDYRLKSFKFWWWWSEYSGYPKENGSHPKFVTTEHARAFAGYLRTPTPNTMTAAVA